MNCKPGDLALVAKTFTGSDSEVPGSHTSVDLRGKIVRCVRLVDGVEWLLETPFKTSYVMNYPTGGIEAGLVQINTIGDMYLVPLANPSEDAEDETLSWLPVPSIADTAVTA